MSNCRSCKAPIIWAYSEAGNPMPIDAEPSDDGNIELLHDDNGRIDAQVISPLFLATPTTAQRHKAHFATCPNAAEHRKTR